MEKWKDIKGFEGKYQISSEGRLKGCVPKWNGNGWEKREEQLYKANVNKTLGYKQFSLVIEPKKYKKSYIHRLVAEHFVDNPKNYRVVNHIDGNKLNNHYTNLEWCTQSQNSKHALDMGLIQRGELGRFIKNEV